MLAGASCRAGRRPSRRLRPNGAPSTSDASTRVRWHRMEAVIHAEAKPISKAHTLVPLTHFGCRIELLSGQLSNAPPSFHPHISARLGSPVSGNPRVLRALWDDPMTRHPDLAPIGSSPAPMASHPDVGRAGLNRNHLGLRRRRRRRRAHDHCDRWMVGRRTHDNLFPDGTSGQSQYEHSGTIAGAADGDMRSSNQNSHRSPSHTHMAH